MRRLWSSLQNLSPLTRILSLGGVCGFLGIGVLAAAARTAAPRDFTDTLLAEPVVVTAIKPNILLERLIADSLLGLSGKLRVRFVAGPLTFSYPGVDFAHGTQPGLVPVAIPGTRSVFNFVSLIPFRQKLGDRVGAYVVGYWPGELRRMTTDAYENPPGFIEVTERNEKTKVSEHFSLGDFITRDQQRGWPKYVVLQEGLLDKLELVIADLEKRGIPVSHARVLSGFRTPYHNLYGLGSEGGARDSRHQYGDAADVIIDNNRDGRMDDLNRDRRVDMRDLEIVLQAVERVERTHPDLVGGLGKYHAIGPSGPFAHIDVRGYRARWNNEPAQTTVAATVPRAPSSIERPGHALKLARCNAAPEFAVLCGGNP